MQINIIIVSHIIGGSFLTTEIFTSETEALARVGELKNSLNPSDYKKEFTQHNSFIQGVKNIYNENGDFIVIERK